MRKDKGLNGDLDLLRDVINKLNGIHFTSSDELHTLRQDHHE